MAQVRLQCGSGKASVQGYRGLAALGRPQCRAIGTGGSGKASLQGYRGLAAQVRSSTSTLIISTHISKAAHVAD